MPESVALGHKSCLLILNVGFLGFTEFQLVLFLHFQTDHLKDQSCFIHLG